MLTCAACEPILLDYVYGLLEGDELQEVRTHLEACPNCRLALETVRAEQNLLARAARAIQDVPEFAPPRGEIELVPAGVQTVSAQALPTPPQRSKWRRPWVAWATAAMVLLSVSAAISLYRSTLHGYQDELARKRQEYKQVELQVAQLPKKYQELQIAALRRVHTEAAPYLCVVGPTQLHADATATLHVTTRRAEGELTASTVRIRLEDTVSKKILQQTLLANAKGEAQVHLAAADATPGSQLNLVVEAHTANGQAILREALQVAPPEIVTRIDTNKNVYQSNDVLFCRVLVLDRYSMKPPAQPLWLHTKLLNPQRAVVAQRLLPTGDGGMIAAEFPIEPGAPEGQYTLEVSQATPQEVLPLLGGSAIALNGISHGWQGAASNDLFARKTALSVPTTRLALEVVRDLRGPDIQFDQDRYAAGDVVSGRLPNGPIANERATVRIGSQTVPATIQPQAQAFGSAPGMGGGGGQAAKQEGNKKETKHLDEALAMRRFTTRLPSNLPAGAANLPFTLQLQDGKRREEFKTVVPLQPSDYAIDFFPEGGDLVAGVPNRVFYRVYAKSGEPITGDGWVVLLSSKHEPIDSRYQLGLGYFDFTPDTKESYTVRITAPTKTSEIVQPFAKLGIRPTGVVLHVPTAVGKQGEPITLSLRNQGPPSKFMLLAQCRGSVIEQRWLDAKTGSQDVTLPIPSNVRGMIRVTAYEVQGSSLEPLAERLVYRSATERLDLGITLNTQQLEAGRTLVGTIKARTEKGASAPSWVLASVVDERFQAKPRSLSAYFFLLNETRGNANLDDAQIVLHDHPDSTPLLERFLGTHGWRRFVRPPSTNTPIAAKPAVSLIFSRENVPLAELQKNLQTKLAQALTPLHQHASLEQLDLEDQQAHASEAVNLARLALWNFEGQIQLWLRLALGIAVALLLLLSLLLLLAGIYRTARRHKAATSAFGSAFASLAVCLTLVFVGTSLAPLDLPAPMAEKNARPFAWDLHQLDWLPFPTLPSAKSPSPTGEFALRSRQSPERTHENGAFSALAGMKSDQIEMQKAPLLLARQAQIATDRDREQARGVNDAKYRGGNAMHLRYENALKEAQKAGLAASENGKPVAPASMPQVAATQPTPAPKVKKASAEARPDAQMLLKEAHSEREYFYQHAPNQNADTLLWSPALWLKDGSAEVHFDLASGQATYRVLLLGHSPSGRFGFYETQLDVPAVGR